MASTATALAHRFTDGIYEEGLSDVLRGLLYIPRQLSHTWLYDERGCRLFEKIRELPEYYLTRTESALLRAHVAEIGALLGEELAVIEYGSGNGAMMRVLLEALPAVCAYVPIDIAASSLARAARGLRRDYPGLTVMPLCADFTRRIELPLPLGSALRRLIYVPGSMLGNYQPLEARRLLTAMRELAGVHGAALLGIDLCEEREVLERAYDDSRGLTAELDLNALRHVNRRLGLGFDVSRFRHRAVWMEAERRIEMHLVSTVDQSVRMGAAVIRLQRGDLIRTQCSRQFTADGFARLAAEAGWAVHASWTDPQCRCSVQLLGAAG